MNTSSRINSSFGGGSPSMSLNTSSFSKRRTPRHGHVGGGESGLPILSRNLTHLVEPFGTNLPSMVKVAVNKVEENDSQKVSCRLDPNGWAWLVRKRKLYIWRHTSDGKRSSIPCRELTLPPSELVHHAQLVCIVGTGVVPACIAVSPEGHISYWPNISNESSTISINADVPGQECYSLSSFWPTGCILATTSATVLLIRPTSGNKPALSCVSLSMASKGWLGGLGKKMSYLMPMGIGSHLETKRAKVVIPTCKVDPAQPGGKNSTVYILAGGSIQVWKVSPELQQSSSEFNVDDVVRKLFHEKVWDKNADLRGIQIWVLDIISLPNNKLAVLAASMNQGEVNKNLHYGIVCIDPKNVRSRDSTHFTIVKYTTPKLDLDEEYLYSWKLIFNQDFYYMISEKLLLVVLDDNSLDSITNDIFGSPINGCGHVPEGVLLFLPKHGLTIIRAQPTLDSKMTDESFADIRVPDHLSLSVTQHNLLDLSMSDDHVNRYKSAFLNYCGKRNEECTDILSNLFPMNVPRSTPNDPIDVWTVALCEKLIDDAPVSDPRWNLTLRRADDHDPMGIKSKMLIKNFLGDKKEGLEIFFGFLKMTGIYDRLTGVVIREDIESTASVLYNFYEKIRFAITVHSLQTEVKYRRILDAAVKSVILHRSELRSVAQLSYNDLFYKDVSRVHQILSALVQIQEELLTASDPIEIPKIVHETTEVILVTFSELTKVQSPQDQFEFIRATLIQPLLTDSQNTSAYNVTPWYVQHHVYEALVKQAEILVSTCKLTQDSSIKVTIFRQLEQLTDLILDGLRIGTESLKASDRYNEKLTEFEFQRGKLLDNLLEIDRNEALPLAEKYLDFNVLVGVCYANKDIQKLEGFFEKYAQLDFPNYTFEWYIRHKKQVELIETFSLRRSYQALLSSFVKDYPQLEWHHLSMIEDFGGAATVLKGLADKEEGSADDKKFMLCMAKLGTLISSSDKEKREENPELSTINDDLKILAFQNELSDELLEHFAMDRKTMRVLTPSELIDVYTCDAVDLDVRNYWQALTLTEYAGGCSQEKRLLVLARAILRDPWDTFSTEHPVDVIEPSLLYKLLLLEITHGEAVDDVFPLTELSSLEMLSHLFEDPNARFLLHACYEHLCSQVSDMKLT